MFQFILMVREAFPITSFIPVPGMREMEALGNSTAVTCILQHKGDKGEKRKSLYFVSQSEHKTRFKFWLNTNCPQREYLPWHVVFDITKPKFLIAGQIREMLLLHILLQDFQPSLLGYRKTVISSVAFDTAWEFIAMCFWLRKWDGHRVIKNRVSHLRLSSLFQISVLLPLMAVAELTDSVSEIKWTSIWHTVLSSSFLYPLCCALKLFFTACDQVISFHCHCFDRHTRIQSNTRAWKHHTYHIPAPSGWSSLWVQGWRWAVCWTNLRGGESSKYSPSSLFFTGPVNKYLWW